MAAVADHYRAYIDCLNARRWPDLVAFVAPRVVHNGRALDRAGYAALIAEPVTAAPDLRFAIATLVTTGEATVAARLTITVTPVAAFLGLPPTGATVSFAEHAFYRLEAGLIAEVWSLLDREALAAALIS